MYLIYLLTLCARPVSLRRTLELLVTITTTSDELAIYREGFTATTDSRPGRLNLDLHICTPSTRHCRCIRAYRRSAIPDRRTYGSGRAHYDNRILYSESDGACARRYTYCPRRTEQKEVGMSIGYKRLRTRTYNRDTRQRHTSPCDRERKVIAMWTDFKRTEMLCLGIGG